MFIKDIALFKKYFLENGIACQMLDNNVKIFFLAGESAEEGHDMLDFIIEDLRLNDVITTWHENESPNELAIFIDTMVKSISLIQLIAIMDVASDYEKQLKKSLEYLWIK